MEIQVMPTEATEHCGPAAPFTLIENKDGQPWLTLRSNGTAASTAEREEVRDVEGQYGILRAKALTPRESMTFVEGLLGEL